MIRRAPLSCSKPSLVAELFRELPTLWSYFRPTLAAAAEFAQLPRERGWLDLVEEEKIQGASCRGC